MCIRDSITTIEGQEPKRDTAVIEKIALSSDNPNRNMVVRVTDPRLLTACLLYTSMGRIITASCMR